MSEKKRKLYFTLEGDEIIKRFMAVKKELDMVSNLSVLRLLELSWRDTSGKTRNWKLPQTKRWLGDI